MVIGEDFDEMVRAGRTFVSKQDASRRQLASAVKMLFDGGVILGEDAPRFVTAFPG